jgi:hypothetical protein
MTLFQNEGNSIANTNFSSIKPTFNVFDLNTVEEYKKLIPKQNLAMTTVLTSLFFIIVNGSEELLDQMIKIDK